MTTVLISGGGDVPELLGEIVGRASSALVAQHADELGADGIPHADRIVFWSATGDARLRAVAEHYTRIAPAAQQDRVLFIMADDAAVEGCPEWPPDQLFSWPRDEDRLKLAFLTGA
jgi:hypothetical protein